MTRRITLCALTGALYAVLTIFVPGGFGNIQVRVAEALCLLPLLFPETIPGLAVGCLIANLFSPYGFWDILCGTLATTLAVLLVPLMKKKWLAPLPVILINALVVGFVIAWQSTPDSLWANFPIFAAEVGAGETIATFALGVPLLYALPRVSYFQKNWPKLQAGK